MIPISSNPPESSRILKVWEKEPGEPEKGWDTWSGGLQWTPVISWMLELWDFMDFNSISDRNRTSIKTGQIMVLSDDPT